MRALGAFAHRGYAVVRTGASSVKGTDADAANWPLWGD